MAVKLAASMTSGPSANRQSTELAANATIARPVNIRVLTINLDAGVTTVPHGGSIHNTPRKEIHPLDPKVLG